MESSKQTQNPEWFRVTEGVFVGVFITASLILLLLSPNYLSAENIDLSADSGVSAQANAMPNQGWAPVTVFFSAFGSNSTSGEIKRYEWDLDGNGIYDTDAASTGGYTSYYYAKPGEYQVTLRVTDSSGQTATDSLWIYVRHPGSASVDYWSIFDDSTVGRVTIEITQENWDAMWSDPEEKKTVPANAVIFGERLNNIGLRFRGQFSLRESGEKKPLKIDTDYYLEGQEFHNLKQIMFVNSIGDPTMIQEKLTYDMLAFAGVPASFVSYAELWIDFSDDEQPAEFWGVYTLIERVDRKFLASRFGNDNRNGNLYKASHAQRGPMDLIYYGPEITDYPTQNGQYAYGKMTNEEENDYSDVVQLAYIIDGASYETPEDFAQALETVFNVDGFLRYMAVMVAVASWDYYPYTGNNFYLYNDPGTNRFEWIPWDQTWGGEASMPLYEIKGFGLLERAPLYERVFEVPRYRQKFAAYLDLLARYWFNYENIYQQSAYHHNLISPYVNQAAGDKAYFGETAWFNYNEFENGWQRLADFAGERSQFILENLTPVP
ncbi:MAG: CotH kinase family protein [Anaerolineales bacterium]|nr:CotH kinase family protein [Anaerolineales bacterium]